MSRFDRDLLAIDPGANTGYVLFSGSGTMVEYCHIRGCSVLLAEHYLAKAHERGVRTLVIEDQYYSRNPATFKTLVERRAEWAVLAAVRGWDVYYVGASVWQKHFGVTTKRGQPRHQHKELMRLRACELSHGELPHDVCDAYLLGRYFIEAGHEEVQNANNL